MVACLPVRSLGANGRGGVAPALAALLAVRSLLAQWRGHVGTRVALVGQVLVEGHGGARLVVGGAARQHVILTHVRKLPGVTLGVTASACEGGEQKEGGGGGKEGSRDQRPEGKCN